MNQGVNWEMQNLRNARITERAVVFTADLSQLDILEEHTQDIGRPLWVLAQCASDNKIAGMTFNKMAGMNPAMETPGTSFQKAYGRAVYKAFKPDDTGIDPAVARVLKAVHSYDYEPRTLATTKTTAEIPAGHAMFILPYNSDLARLCLEDGVGTALKGALENAPDGMVAGLGNEKAGRALSAAFFVTKAARHRPLDEAYSALRGVVTLNRSEAPRHAFIEGGGMSTFGAESYADRDGVTPQLV